MANLLTPLLPHQENVIERLRSLPGLILYHGVGSGKTLSSIAAANALGGRTTVVAPSALLPNYRKELEKHLDNAKKFKLLSLQSIARTPKLLRPSDILIVDEAHKIRNPWSSAFKAIEKVPFQKKIFLSGTPIYNSSEDIDNLARLIDPEKPAKDLVDYYKAEDRSQYPGVKEEVVKVPADKYQKQIHRFYKKPNEQLLYNLLVGLPIEKLDKANESNYIQDWFRNVTRQVSNEAAGFHIDAKENSPKIKQVVNDIKTGPGKTIVYSNFLASGLDPVAKQLDKQNIPYAFFTGDVTKAEKEKAVKDFNEDKLPVLLLSSSGAEGLDLKGTRQVQIIEPHWNDKKIQQVIGRAVRYKSHESLPKEEKNVIVKRYIDTTGTRTRTADEILYDMSKKKELQSMIREKTFVNK